jgi:lysophospholipase L1-like esterase
MLRDVLTRLMKSVAGVRAAVTPYLQTWLRRVSAAVRPALERARAHLLPVLHRAREAALRWRDNFAIDLAAARRAGGRDGWLTFARTRWIEVAVSLQLLLVVIALLALALRQHGPAPAPQIAEATGPAERSSAAAPTGAAPSAGERELTERPKDSDSVALRALGRELHAPGGRVENPCVVTQGPSCMRTALDPFFEALDQARSAGHPTVALALGNSLIAGDGVVDVVRARLADRFGDAGRGYLLADRMASYGGRARCSAKASGWIASTFAPPYKLRWPFGIAGVHHTAQQAGAFSTFALHGETLAEVFWLDRPEAKAIEVHVDGALVKTLQPAHEAKGRRDFFTLSGGAHELTLTAKGPGVVLHGVTLEKAQSGIVLDMLGVPSADASIFLQADEAIFEDQLQARHPSLVMLMFGGNETKRIAWGRSSEEKVVRDLRTLIGRVKKAGTGACWVIGPLDAVVKRPSGPYTQRPELEEVISMERQVALEEGCAWFDLFQAMGGSGSIKRFDQAGLMHPDRVHPKGRGLDLLGQLIVDALFDEYAKARAPAPAEAAR